MQQGQASLVKLPTLTFQNIYCCLCCVPNCGLQDRLRIDVAAWDADDQRLGAVVYTIAFKEPTYIDLRRDMRFSGIHKLSIISSGGKPGTTCQNGKQVVIDNLEIYLQRD